MAGLFGSIPAEYVLLDPGAGVGALTAAFCERIARLRSPFFENGAAAFERKNQRAEEAKDRRIAALQQKLADKNEVIAELMEENVRSKKANGEL